MRTRAIYGCAGHDAERGRARVLPRRAALGLHPLRAQHRRSATSFARWRASCARRSAMRRAPILIDQEGGRVARLKPPHWQARPAGGALRRAAMRAQHEAGARGGLSERAADRARSLRSRHQCRLPAGARRAGRRRRRRDRRPRLRARSGHDHRPRPRRDRGPDRGRRAAGDEAHSRPRPRDRRQPSGAAARGDAGRGTQRHRFRDLPQPRTMPDGDDGACGLRGDRSPASGDDQPQGDSRRDSRRDRLRRSVDVRRRVDERAFRAHFRAYKGGSVRGLRCRASLQRQDGGDARSGRGSQTAGRASAEARRSRAVASRARRPAFDPAAARGASRRTLGRDA